MGLEGDRLCGSTWVPRNQPPAPAPLFSPPTTTVAPAPAPVYSPPAVERSGGTVHPGSFCSTPGATGVTTKGNQWCAMSPATERIVGSPRTSRCPAA
ncbi:hypothetical protein JOE46_000243 [Rhodococcus sp. PvR099]|nr:hypothetical protein [Rhodococcus sp. PvR099]